MESTIDQLIEALLNGIRACTATETRYVPIDIRYAREIIERLEDFKRLTGEEEHVCSCKCKKAAKDEH